MKVGTLHISPPLRVVAFAFGVMSAWMTFKHISTGVTRYGGVENTRADQPFAYWSVVGTMAYVTILFFCAALVKRKTTRTD